MDTLHPPVAVRPSDLTTYARIRNAALEGFASKGLAATSIRDVAAAAGVSPGLVQHHFGTKAGLRDAVNEYVVAVAAEALQDVAREADGDELWALMGDMATRWVRDNAIALRYVARGIADGDPGALQIFDAVVGIARTNWLVPLARAGRLRADLDGDWAAIHVIVFNLACVLLEAAISRQLPEPFFTPAQLRRWNVATTELYRRGATKPVPASRRKRSRG